MKGALTKGLIVIAVVGAVGFGYFLGRQSANPVPASGKSETAATPAATPPAASTAPPASATQPVLDEAGQPVRAMPPGHPPIAVLQTPAPRPGPEGVAIEPPARYTHFRVGPRNVKSLLADGDVMWVGTSGGVIRYDTKTDQYELFDTKSGLLANGIFHLSRIDGRLAAGTYGGGLALQKPGAKEWRIYNVPDGLADAFVYDTLKSANGDIWIATWSGVNRVQGGTLDDPSKWQTFTVENTNGGLPNDWVYALENGKDGTVWMATEGGLAHYRDGQWEHWQHEDGLGAAYELVEKDIKNLADPSKISEHHARQKTEFGLQGVDVAYNPNYIVALLVDSGGDVWCGTWGGGLARFDGSQWTNYTVADGLPGNHVFMLHEDPAGKLWIGTSAGLARRQGQGFVKFGTHDGLFADNVFSMAIAADGSLWIGSYGGVARITSLP